MAIGNRVDDLEEEVEELKATVQGLTEELVEAHERIRQIERALAGDPETAREVAREAASEVAAGIENMGVGDVTVEPGQGGQGDSATGSGGRIFGGVSSSGVTDAAPETAETVEADKREGVDGGDEAEGESDDIIVA